MPSIQTILSHVNLRNPNNDIPESVQITSGMRPAINALSVPRRPEFRCAAKFLSGPFQDDICILSGSVATAAEIWNTSLNKHECIMAP